jgi:histidinol dehydrogenase
MGTQIINQNTIFLLFKTLDIKTKNFEKTLISFLNLRRGYSSEKVAVIKKIINNVEKYGDRSLIKYEKKFNNIKILKRNNLFFSNQEIERNIKFLNQEVKDSIDLAFSRIFSFHKNQKFHSFKKRDKINNTFYYRSKPVEKVGIYVPGGKASYPSSVLMNCIPALIAGVSEIFMTVPSFNGRINPGVLYAAKKCKVKKIFKLSGAQAVAAFAFGTKTVPKVNKIVGPGNEYVALAKKEVSGITGIDMFAGPSEVTVVADKYSKPEWVSADLIAQSEHDEMSQSILVTNSRKLIFEVINS